MGPVRPVVFVFVVFVVLCVSVVSGAFVPVGACVQSVPRLSGVKFKHGRVMREEEEVVDLLIQL